MLAVWPNLSLAWEICLIKMNGYPLHSCYNVVLLQGRLNLFVCTITQKDLGSLWQNVAKDYDWYWKQFVVCFGIDLHLGCWNKNAKNSSRRLQTVDLLSSCCSHVNRLWARFYMGQIKCHSQWEMAFHFIFWL